jgi:tetratricopeptide (TPR) repeat protein
VHLQWLWSPDARAWSCDPLYRPVLARTLRAAFARVASPAMAGPADYLWACAQVAPWVGMQVAAPQHVRICFLFARTHEIERNYVRATDWVDEAMGVAARGRLVRELAELLVYRGKLLRAREKFAAATENLREAMALLAANAAQEEAIDPALRLELLSQLATYKFYLADYRSAMRLAREARKLATQAPALEYEAASALLVEALIERVRGYPERALRPALEVAAVLERVATPTSQDRIHTFVAELALDLVGTVPGGPNSLWGQELLSLARKHLKRAGSLARGAGDLPGVGLQQLASIRASRLRSRNEDRRASIERVIRTARELNDDALLAQGFTALGDELTFLGATEQALNRYREALATIANTEIPALADPARRALLLASELHVQ